MGRNTEQGHVAKANNARRTKVTNADEACLLGVGLVRQPEAEVDVRHSDGQSPLCLVPIHLQA